MEDKYILSIDQSTSATKAILFNCKGEIVHKCSKEHKQIYPKLGWVEHNPEEIYEKTVSIINTLIKESEILKEHIKCLTITNQRETIVVWNKKTGKPVYNAIVWQCQRGNDICKKIKEQGYENVIKEKTGLMLSPYFSASKVQWILDNVDNARESAERGELLMGTMDSWLLWKFTEGQVHATDYSNASRTLLYNIKELQWDLDLLKVFNIPKSMLPEVKSSNEIFGYTNINEYLAEPIPISGIMGDSHAALFGQNCYEKGMAKATYGTGSSIMMNIGEEMIQTEKGVVTSLAWGLDGRVSYVLEGNINCAGDTVKWISSELNLLADPASAGEISSTLSDNGGVYIVPAFTGLGAPYWDSEARASITGISRGTTKAHIIRAGQEAIAYQIKDIVGLMIQESGINLRLIKVDGGPTSDDFLMQFQADMLNIPVVCSQIQEISALGSMFMAGLGIKLFNNVDEIVKLRIKGKTFYSKMDESISKKLYKGWKEAVRRTLSN